MLFRSAFVGNYDCSGDQMKEGDIVVFNKYAGIYQEFPPGSGDIYHFCNDVDAISKYKSNVLEAVNV